MASGQLSRGALTPSGGSDAATDDTVDAEHGGATPVRRRIWPELVGVLWVLGAAIAVLLPALSRGRMLGAYDWLSQYGFTAHAGAVVRDPLSGDQITQMIPWVDLSWTQVHQGHIPLWNPWSALGMPLAFNWQSASFSLPSLVGYAFPLRYAYTVQVIVTLWVAGSGAYFFGRILKLGVAAAAFAGTVFELSGAYFMWLGWPIASVLSWSGWLMAAVVIILSGRHRIGAVCLFSISLACAVYAGQPDALVLLLMVVALFTVALFTQRATAERSLRALGRPVASLAVASVTGIFLAAPLLLPGVQLISGSVRSAGGGALHGKHALPGAEFVHAAFSGVLARTLPDYVGVVAVALVAIAIRFRIRRPTTVALLVVAVVSGAIAFLEPVTSAANAVPGLSAVRFPRMITLLAFALAVLAAIGLDAFITTVHRRRVGGFLMWTCAGLGALLVALVAIEGSPATSSARTIWLKGIAWSVGGLAVGLVVALITWRQMGRSAVGRVEPTASTGVQIRSSVWSAGQWCGAALLVFETTFLVANGAGMWASSATGFPVTPATSSYQRIVGTSTVGFGVSECLLPPGLGIRVNANVAYGVHQLAVYDPLTPSMYYTAWTKQTGRPAGYPGFSHYCPAISTVQEARLYGVGYVLEPGRSPGPAGSVFAAELDGQGIYRIPGSSPATLLHMASGSTLPPIEDDGTPIGVSHPDPASWRMATTSSVRSVLRLRLVDVPGWHATIDGRPLTLERFAGVMLQARIPPGRHLIVVQYWPTRFSIGLVLAVVSALGLLVALVWSGVSRRRSSRRLGPRSRGGVSSLPLSSEADSVVG